MKWMDIEVDVVFSGGKFVPFSSVLLISIRYVMGIWGGTLVGRSHSNVNSEISGMRTRLPGTSGGTEGRERNTKYMLNGHCISNSFPTSLTSYGRTKLKLFNIMSVGQNILIQVHQGCIISPHALPKKKKRILLLSDLSKVSLAI